MIDRVAAQLGRRLYEVPVGFKWFVDGLLDGSLGFGGEESAGASFLRRDGTRLDDRQGRHHPGAARRPRSPRAPGRDPGELYRELTRELGEPVYERIDAPATPAQKAALAEALAAAGRRHRAGRRADRGDAHHARRATARRSAGSR